MITDVRVAVIGMIMLIVIAGLGNHYIDGIF